MTDLMNVHLVTLGCARNEVDSEELAARLAAGGFQLVDDADDADAVMVNTCGFIEQAKKDSVDTLMEAADLKEGGRAKAVVAVGCMAERYGKELAESMPEADAVLGFDDYATIADKLTTILAGGHHEAHTPRDRRSLLPLTPVDRSAAAASVAIPGHDISMPELPEGLAPASGPRTLRRRLGSSPQAPLKIASGCDRRCSFCAIPRFRGAYLSRGADEILDEARWLVEQGVKEVFLVSENSSSYGKDLGDIRALEKLLTSLSDVDGLDWIRVSYLQPAELRPSLIEQIAVTDKVVPYFDLSFQHASGPVLRKMRRFGDAQSFLDLLERVRSVAPQAGIRSNFIVGFPGESEADFDILTQFVQEARLDVAGVFGYSDEDDTEALSLDGKLDEDEVMARANHLSDLTAELCAQRAEDRIGEVVTVLIEGEEDGVIFGRAEHQGPEVDGITSIPGASAAVGEFVVAAVESNDGIDLIATEVGR